jgi:hypothetical protein
MDRMRAGCKYYVYAYMKSEEVELVEHAAHL